MAGRCGIARGFVLGCVLTVLAGCGSSQSTLNPESDPAHEIETLWWVMFVGSALVFAVVTALVLVAVLRRRGTTAPPDGEHPLARRLVLWGGAIVPLAILVALFVLILRAIPETAAARAEEGRLTFRVVGRQWFWDIYYPREGFRTANEIHIPVGVPVRLEARTGDVLHSFWVPALNRKIDMVPKKPNAILLHADRAGVYRGQCAEFCGLQHAEMAVLVVAQPPREFRAWLEAQRRPSSSSQLFLDAGCGNCHRIRGTAAVGNVGPDLTHVASRSYIAAGALANDEENLRRWIANPQTIKPGARMPDLPLTDEQVRELAAYLRTLR
jgi:cytochrome c oxidase subunit 2